MTSSACEADKWVVEFPHSSGAGDLQPCFVVLGALLDLLEELLVVGQNVETI